MMPSPYQDPDALRRGRNRQPSAVDQGRARKVPPPLPAGTEWPAWLAKWWTDVWTSPLTAEWDELLDVQPAARLGSLYLAMRQNDELSAALLAQVQRLESELGLSPAARKRMHVKAAQAAAVPPPGRGSARDRLLVVDSPAEP